MKYLHSGMLYRHLGSCPGYRFTIVMPITAPIGYLFLQHGEHRLRNLLQLDPDYANLPRFFTKAHSVIKNAQDLRSL